MVRDELIFKKIYTDENDLIELKISSVSNYVSIWQKCYIDKKELCECAQKIYMFSFQNSEECYIEFGRKTGNYTPSFSMKFFPHDNHGHITIELDFEINDNSKRIHRCSFYISSDIYSVENFGKALKKLSDCAIGSEVSL